MYTTNLIAIFFFSTLVSRGQEVAKNTFVLNGKITGGTAKMVYLSYTDSSGSVIADSCLLNNRIFSFKGNIAHPTAGVIKTNATRIEDAQNNNIATIFLEATMMEVNIKADNFSQLELTGSQSQKQYNMLAAARKIINKNHNDNLFDRHSELTQEFIFNNRESYISAYELNFYKGRWPRHTIRYLFERLSPQVRISKYGKDVKSFLVNWDSNSEGSKMQDFVTEELKGKILDSETFRGSYVLLDFWGSWCLPCRESSPHLIQLHKKYSANSFQIIGIATEYDDTIMKWKKAIEEDRTDIWFHVLSSSPDASSRDFTNDIAGMFGVHTYPTKILIDPCGYIIGRYQGTDQDAALDELLRKLFN